MSTVLSRPTLAGQGVVADDGDAEALAVVLGYRNLVDLISLQVGLKQTESPFIIGRAVSKARRIQSTETKRKQTLSSFCALLKVVLLNYSTTTNS